MSRTALLLIVLTASCGSMDSELEFRESAERESLANGILATIPGTGVLIADLPDGQGLCTASLIGARTLLTAAHCVEFDNADYYFSTAEGVPDDLATTNRAIDVFIHPGYVDSDSTGAPNVRLQFEDESLDLPVSRFDLAIVHLAGVETSPPLRLAPEAPAPNAMIELVGRGQTEPDRQTDGRTRVGQNRIHAVTTDGFAYLEATGPLSNVCQGDSGGPSLNSRGEVIGVHSLGTCTLIQRVGIWPFQREIDLSVGFDAGVNTAETWITNLIVDDPLAPTTVAVLTSDPEPMIGDTVNVDVRWESGASAREITVSVDGFERVAEEYDFQSPLGLLGSLRLEVSEFQVQQSRIDVEVLDWAGQTIRAGASVSFVEPPPPPAAVSSTSDEDPLTNDGGCAATGNLGLVALLARRRRTKRRS
ncbi:MAG: S1 family peptidase [Myxococcota bacterium]